MDGDSDRSSICRSPAWDDAEKKRQRKVKQDIRDKRKKEKERATWDKKRVHAPKKRLTKAPPTNRNSKTETARDKSSSASLIPMATETLTRKCVDQSWHLDSGPETVDTETFNYSEQVSRNSRHADNSSQFDRSISLRADDGFIGGVKLRMSQEQERSAAHALYISKNEFRPLEHCHSGSATLRDGPSANIQPDVLQNNDPALTNPLRSHPIPSHQPDSNGHKFRSAVPQPTSIMNRGIKRGQKDQKAIAEYIYPSSNIMAVPKSRLEDTHHHVAPIRTDSSRQVSSSSQIGFQKANTRDRASRANDGPPLSYREPAALVMDTPGRGYHRDYIQGERWQSRDRANEDPRIISSDAGSIRSHSRGRSWSITSIASRARRSFSSSRPMTGDPERRNASHERLDEDHSYDLRSPSANLTLGASPEVEPSRSRRASISSIASSFIGFRNDARGTSFEQCNTPKPPLSEVSTVGEKSKKPRLKKKEKILKLSSGDSDTTDGVANLRLVLPEKASDPEKVSENLSHLNSTRVYDNMVLYAQTDTPKSKSPAKTISKSGNPDRTKLEGSQASSTNFAEDTYDEFASAITTSDLPSQSPSNSPLLLNTTSEDAAAHSNPSSINSVTSRPSSSRAFSFVESISGEDDGDRTSTPTIPNVESEELQRIPTKKPPQRFSLLGSLKLKQQKNNNAASIIDPVDYPNLSRKSSRRSSAIDFGFLPQLKHQPLQRPKKGEDSETSLKPPIFDRTDSEDGVVSKAVIKSPPPPSQSRTSSFTHPPPFAPSGSSNSYPASSSSSTLRSHSPHRHDKIRYPTQGAPPTPLPEISPLAKMFVICCSCHYYHDLPSKVYECMTKPDNVVEDRELGVRGVVSTGVRCPWCGHGMSRSCCEGYVGLVYLRERVH